jgi:hypothetical protein
MSQFGAVGNFSPNGNLLSFYISSLRLAVWLNPDPLRREQHSDSKFFSYYIFFAFSSSWTHRKHDSECIWLRMTPRNQRTCSDFAGYPWKWFVTLNRRYFVAPSISWNWVKAFHVFCSLLSYSWSIPPEACHSLRYITMYFRWVSLSEKVPIVPQKVGAIHPKYDLSGNLRGFTSAIAWDRDDQPRPKKYCYRPNW